MNFFIIKLKNIYLIKVSKHHHFATKIHDTTIDQVLMIYLKLSLTYNHQNFSSVRHQGISCGYWGKPNHLLYCNKIWNQFLVVLNGILKTQSKFSPQTVNGRFMIMIRNILGELRTSIRQSFLNVWFLSWKFCFYEC